MDIPFKRRPWRAAVTLVELTMAMALSAIVIFGAVRSYWNAAENSRLSATADLVGIARSAVASRYAVAPNYASLSTSVIASFFAAGLVSGDGAGGSQIANPYKGVMQIGPDRVSVEGDSFYISFNNLPQGACHKLIRQDFGRDASYVKVDAGNGLGGFGAAMALPLNEVNLVAATGACAGAKQVSVAIQFAGR